MSSFNVNSGGGQFHDLRQDLVALRQDTNQGEAQEVKQDLVNVKRDLRTTTAGLRKTPAYKKALQDFKSGQKLSPADTEQFALVLGTEYQAVGGQLPKSHDAKSLNEWLEKAQLRMEQLGKLYKAPITPQLSSSGAQDLLNDLAKLKAPTIS